MSTGSIVHCVTLLFCIGASNGLAWTVDDPKSDDKATTKSPIAIRLQGASEKSSKPEFVVTGISEKALQELARSKWKQEQWTSLFSVCVDNTQTKEKSQPIPAVIGAYRIESNTLI